MPVRPHAQMAHWSPLWIAQGLPSFAGVLIGLTTTRDMACMPQNRDCQHTATQGGCYLEDARTSRRLLQQPPRGLRLGCILTCFPHWKLDGPLHTPHAVLHLPASCQARAEGILVLCSCRHALPRMADQRCLRLLGLQLPRSCGCQPGAATVTAALLACPCCKTKRL